MNEDKLDWQLRDEMSTPTNPLQKLYEILALTSRDVSKDQMVSCIYGIVVGWDDYSYKELKELHKWTDEDIKYQKMLHKNYNRAWSFFMSNERGVDS